MGLFGEYTEEINQKELYANPCVVCCDPRNSKFRMEEIYCVSAFAILRFSQIKCLNQNITQLIVYGVNTYFKHPVFNNATSSACSWVIRALKADLNASMLRQKYPVIEKLATNIIPSVTLW